MTPEDLALAIQTQRAQQRLGAPVQSVEEILSGTCERLAKKSRPTRIPIAPMVRYHAPEKSNPATVIPFTGPSIGGTMESNTIVSHKAVARLESKMKDAGATAAQIANAFRVLMHLSAKLGFETPKSGCTIASVARDLDLHYTQVTRAVSGLETAGIIRRSSSGREREILVSPEYLYRGRSARFADVMAEWEKTASGTD